MCVFPGLVDVGFTQGNQSPCSHTRNSYSHTYHPALIPETPTLIQKRREFVALSKFELVQRNEQVCMHIHVHISIKLKVFKDFKTR